MALFEVVVALAVICVTLLWLKRRTIRTIIKILLDGSDGVYGSEPYWSHRYVEEPAAYEWYAVKFTDIVDDMATLFRKSASILDMGCGTSGFVDDARKAGWSNIIGGDFCADLIPQLRLTYPDCRFETMDLSDLSHFFSTGTLEGLIDKGTMDGLMGSHTENDLARAQAVVKEAVRVLAPGAHWINIGITNPAKFKEILKGPGAQLTLVSNTKRVVVISGKPGESKSAINVYTQVFRR